VTVWEIHFDCWKCNRCGREFRYSKGERPPACPNCGKKSFLQALTGIFSFFNEKGVLMPVLLAEEILRTERFISLPDGTICRFVEGHYVPDGEKRVEEFCKVRLGKFATKRRIREVVRSVQIATYTRKVELDPKLFSCAICGSTEKIVRHHTSYTKNQIVFLCSSCHSKVHRGYYPDLLPHDGRTTKGRPLCAICGKREIVAGKDWINGTVLWMCDKCYDKLTPRDPNLYWVR